MGFLVFTKDAEFSSPSAAAVVIHGGSANGLVVWKTKDGVSLNSSTNKREGPEGSNMPYPAIDVAHALVRAVSRLFSTPARAGSRASARVPTRHHECVRYVGMARCFTGRP